VSNRRRQRPPRPPHPVSAVVAALDGARLRTPA